MKPTLALRPTVGALSIELLSAVAGGADNDTDTAKKTGPDAESAKPRELTAEEKKALDAVVGAIRLATSKVPPNTNQTSPPQKP